MRCCDALAKAAGLCMMRMRRNKGGGSGIGWSAMYVCNCNGIRERDLHQAAEDGAEHPAQVFRRHGCMAKCGRCVQEMQSFLQSASNKTAIAAE